MEDRFENFEAALPLSPEQRAVLAMHRGAALPPLAVSVTIEGALDEAHLRTVAAEVLQAHEAMRLAMRDAVDPFAWRQQPRATLSASHAQADASMQLQEGGVVRIGLDRVDAAHHRLTLSAHPLAADAASLAALVARIAEACGNEGKADAEPFQYTQFAAWRDALAHDDEEDAVKGRAYWAGYLAGGEALAAPRLVARQGDVGDVAAPARRVVERTLDAALLSRLDALARSHGVQVSELLQAAWWALLARLTGFVRFTGGWQHDCRLDYEVMQGAIGVYEKVLPLRVEIGAEEPFADWLARFAAQARTHVEAQEYGVLDAAADAAHLAVGFALRTPDDLPASWQVTQRPGPLPCFELALEVEWSAQRAVFALHANEGRYAAPALERLLQQLFVLLQAVADSPATPVQDLTLIDADERKALLALDGASVDVGTQGIAERIAHWARTTPDAPAIEDGEQRLSYAALDVRINRMAHWMRTQGVQRGGLVALALPRSLDLLVAMLAAWRAGAGYLPLEPEWPAARRAAVLADAKPALLLQAEPVQDADASAWRVAMAGGIDLSAFDVSVPDVPAAPHDLAYVLYTSGSTGKPKGVVIEQAQLLNYVAAASSAMALDGYRRWALTSTVAADLGNTALFGAFFNGACLVVAGAEATKDAAAFTRFMAERRIDAIKIVPSHLEALLEAETPVLPRLLVLGGEAASRSLLERIARAAPPPACTVYNHYGPTETTVGVMVHRLEPGAAFPDQLPLPLSQVLANNRVRVLDHALRLAPTGALGELYIGGAQLCRGYLGGVAAEAFIDDPFAPGERLYRTGDLACVLPGGALRIAGRADHQLKVRGFRVEPGEIEAVLLAQDGVRQAVVLPVAVPAGGVELVACVVGDADKVSGLRERLAALLPAHMVPSRCVQVEAFPRLANGKVDRLALAAAMPASAGAAAPREGAQAPRDALEHLLAAGMAELLGRASIGVDEDFFELGAHSLLVIKLAARIRRLLRVEIAPGLVFDHPSVTTLARAVHAASADPAQTEQLADTWRLEAEAIPS
ncbi:non-ribosomal peptide synthetase [Variovorax boronicumulans]|uniref:Non-ribosomal peptide synthetase n=1 Tax=Variovorax boronicumulans TaxID=436515 RepID=A0A250DP53_9BURK|nr:amino acid adenylation domain-containing protein [Variovorax boronicumulans]ATA56042.1 non-ribosomal peptide synthetase [Variovorax boronicumulans]